MTQVEPNISGYRSIYDVKLGTLRLIVRSEVNAMKNNEENDSISNLTQSMQNLSTDDSSTKSQWTDLHYIHFNQEEYLGRSYIELKTRNANYQNTIDWEDIYYQTLLGGVDKVILGLQVGGNFKTVDSYNLQLTGSVQQRIEETLGKLEVLLDRIIKVVKENGYLHCDIVYNGNSHFISIVPTKTGCVPEGWVLPVKKE